MTNPTLGWRSDEIPTGVNDFAITGGTMQDVTIQCLRRGCGWHWNTDDIHDADGYTLSAVSLVRLIDLTRAHLRDDHPTSWPRCRRCTSDTCPGRDDILDCTAEANGMRADAEARLLLLETHPPLADDEPHDLTPAEPAESPAPERYVVPLVSYDDGDRREIGHAEVRPDPIEGVVIVSTTLNPGVLPVGAADAFSIMWDRSENVPREAAVLPPGKVHVGNGIRWSPAARASLDALNACTCGHDRRHHIYEIGPCRPGFRCPSTCNAFTPVQNPVDGGTP